MSVDRSAEVPQGVEARVRRTSLLGERIVDLVVPDGTPANAPLLTEGATISDTAIRPDLARGVALSRQVLGDQDVARPEALHRAVADLDVDRARER